MHELLTILLTVITVIQAVVYVLQMIETMKAKNAEEEAVWRLRSLSSLGVIILLGVAWLSLKG